MTENEEFERIEKKLKSQERKRIVVVWAADECTRVAVAKAIGQGLVTAVFVGAAAEVSSDENLSLLRSYWTLEEANDADEAVKLAVSMAREGKADVIVKGLINTDNLLRGVLSKEHGIMRPGAVLTHVTVANIPAYGKLLLFSDPAVLPYPNDAQRHEQVKYLVDIARKLDIEQPKVALLHCSEKVEPRHFPFTADYLTIKDMAKDGQFGNCVVDGPIDIKVACSLEAMHKKKLESPINGEADALLFPDIEAANVFYKTITLWGNADTAGLVMGATVPLVVPSRGDNAKCKYNSLLFALSQVQ